MGGGSTVSLLLQTYKRGQASRPRWIKQGARGQEAHSSSTPCAILYGLLCKLKVGWEFQGD